MPLTLDEELRYSRHLILPGFGLNGQERLKRARVLIVGAGGLGSPVALYLAAAGVGHLAIADADVVNLNNLHRQVLHGTEDIGQLKVESAQRSLYRLNATITVEALPVYVSAANALPLIANYDLVVDGCDNFATRYLLNDACVLLKKPYLFGSVYRFEGQVTLLDAQTGPCYRCIFPEPPPPEETPSCAEGGVLGVLPGLIGMVQATEAIKWLTGIGKSLRGRLLLFDALDMRFRELGIEKNPECPVCGISPSIRELIDYQEFCGHSPTATLQSEWEMDVIALQQLQTHHAVTFIDVREEWECDADEGIPGAVHIPYPFFTRRMHELDSAQYLVLVCSAGIRSWHAAALLRKAGFTRVWSLRGGLPAYRAGAQEIDSIQNNLSVHDNVNL